MAVYKIGLIRDTPLNRPIGAYIMMCLFATGMGLTLDFVKGPTAFFFVLKYVEYFVFYFVVVNNIHSRAQIRRFTIALFLTALIVSIVAMAQIPSGARVTAPFEGEQGEPNTLGGYLLFIGALATGLALQLREKWHRRILVGLVGALLLPFFFTLSRGSYLALPFVSLTFIVLHKRGRVAAVVTILALTALASVAMPDRIRERVTGTITERQDKTVAVGSVRLDQSASARVVSWKGAFADVWRSPVWGFGVTGYGFIDAQYPRILVETGFLGLGIFFWLITTVFRAASHVYSESDDPLFKGLSMGLLAGAVGLLVHGLGANTFTIVRIMEPFWLTVGMIVCAGHLESAERGENGTSSR